MPPDSEVHYNQAEVTGEEAEEFGRTSEEGPGPTKQDNPTGQELSYLNKYDILFTPNKLAIQCFGCIEYIWEHEYDFSYSDPSSVINKFPFNLLAYKIIEHHLTCSVWNK